MSPSIDLLPLGRFRTHDQIQALAIAPARPEELSTDARHLLCHHGDMTSRLERFHSEPLSVQALNVQKPEKDGDTYAREVVLHTHETRVPVEYGAIVIYLDPLEPELRTAIVEAREPLGALLEQAGYGMISIPRAFFTATADAYLARHLGVKPGAPLHGRRNRLRIHADCVIAEIVEIVPQ